MLTNRTKRQLVYFMALSLVGIAFVGARYARLDRLVLDTSYSVSLKLRESGGIYEGAEVDYRGVRVGTVGEMRLSISGVDLDLVIDKNTEPIPRDTLAVVTNRSALGEQYVDLQPRTDQGPYLGDGSVIRTEDTQVPVSATELLTNLDRLVTSVPQGSLATAITELGAAFEGRAADLAGLLDDSGAFLRVAHENLEVTTALIADSRTVLGTQLAKGSAIRSFAKDLELLSGTLADNDDALRSLIVNGSATSTELRTFLERNQVDLGSLLSDLVTTGEIVVRHLPGIEQLLVIYPYEIANMYTVIAPNPGGVYHARFGFIFTQNPPICFEGYPVEERRSPTDGSNRPLPENVRCTAPPTKKNARGSQNAPRPGPGREVATYDQATGSLTWGSAGTPEETGDVDPLGWVRSLL